MKAEHAGRVTEDYWEGADLVMEVVSDGDEDRRRDLKNKREEYARRPSPNTGSSTRNSDRSPC